MRVLSLFVFIICIITSFVACAPVDKVIGFFSSDGTGHIFKYALPSNPDTLDPQLADDESSVAVAKNLYAGLMGYDEKGRLIGAMARDYVVSQDGLTYTFYLKEGFKWHALGNYETDVTAGDFVFGFRRLFDPKTESPHSEKYFCIKGASAARNGETETSEVGVKALDDYTVEITLEYPNAELLYLLAELPAMPCCEDYFASAGGKYGLEADAVCSNGPFFVRYWLHDPYGKDNYVRLRRNPGYSDVEPVGPAGINFLITKSADERRSDFFGGSTDAVLFRAGEFADTDGNSVCAYTDTVGLIFNEKLEAFSDAEVRQIFSWAIDREALAGTSPDTLISAEGIVPDNPVIAARGYKASIPEEVSKTNLPMAEYMWSFTLDERQKSALIGSTIMVPDSFGYSDCLKELSACWYDLLSINFSIEVVTQRDYDSRLKSGDYDIALISLSSETAILDYLKPFGSADSYGISLDEVKAAESDEGRYQTLATYNYRCSEAESAILSGYHFIPLWHVPTVLRFDDDTEGLRLDVLSRSVIFTDGKKF